MEELKRFTTFQAQVFQDIISDGYFKQNFYFTGGTALSVFYLNHRQSDDLDFFSLKHFDTQTLFTKINEISKKNNLEMSSQVVENTNYFILNKNNESLKVDFANYPYTLLRTGKKIDGFNIDSDFDIAVNKIITINQRNEVKDFVDLYFLLKEFSIWDLIAGAKEKFNLKIELFILASDMIKAEEFEYLPKMISELELSQLKDYFIDLAKKLGKKSTQ